MKYCYALDIGGTSIKYSRFNEKGQLVRKWELMTNRADNGKYILSDIVTTLMADMDMANIEKSDILGVGVGVPGTVIDDAIVSVAPNLGWTDFPVKYKLRALLGGIPVYVINDANAAALGEYTNAAQHAVKSVVFITLGTGVGGGIIIDGNVITGYQGAGGEIGHLHVEDRETEKCGCGNTGCLEQYSSATGLVRITKKLLDKDSRMESSLHQISNLTAKDVFDACKNEDIIASKAVEILGSYLGKACAMIACAVDPELFVIGGGLSNAGTIVTQVVEYYYRKYAYPGCRQTTFQLAALGNDAGIYGAAYLVLRNAGLK